MNEINLHRISAALFILTMGWSASAVIFFLTYAFAMRSPLAALLSVGWVCCTLLLAMGINNAVQIARGL